MDFCGNWKRLFFSARKRKKFPPTSSGYLDMIVQSPVFDPLWGVKDAEKTIQDEAWAQDTFTSYQEPEMQSEMIETRAGSTH